MLKGVCNVRLIRRVAYVLFRLKDIDLSFIALLLAVFARLHPKSFSRLGKTRLLTCLYSKIISRRIRKIENSKTFHTISIETTNICNARCIFCPHPIMTRKKTVMNDDEFSTIIGKIQESPSLPKSLSFTFFGEPFVDKKIVERISLSRKSLGKKVMIQVTTNGSLLNDEYVDDLFNSGVDLINISFNGFAKEDYEHSMGLEFARPEENVLGLLARRREKYLMKPFINISCIIHSDNEDIPIETFQKKWISAGADTVSVHPMNKHHEQITIDKSTQFLDQGAFYPCRTLWTDCIISVFGDVALCCLDFDTGYITGNIFLQDFREIFEDQRRVNYQQLHLQNHGAEMKICKHCDSPRSGAAWLL